MSIAFFRRGDADRAAGGPSKPRPKIGVALGAGVARGWAHIGALQELQEIGIYPSVIVGASIGAVVGGCFAAGKLDALEQFALSLTRRNVFGFLDVSFNGGGLIGGNKLRNRIESSLGATRIEDLPLKFAAVATEIGAGHEVWLKSGPLVQAMRASYALPGVFEPVQIGGRWLFDGAIVNPVPVNVARALGADLVIALSIGSEGAGRGATLADPIVIAPTIDEVVETKPSGVFDGLRRSGGQWLRRAWTSDGAGPPGMAAVMVNTFNITQDRIMRSRLAGDPPDFLLTMRTSRFGLFEFHRAAELIELGRSAVRRAKDEIYEQLELETV